MPRPGVQLSTSLSSLVTLCVMIGVAAAQLSVPEFRRTKNAYDDQIAEASKAARERFHNNLVTLQDERASRGDYAGAIAVQRRIDRLLKRNRVTNVTTARAGESFTLTPETARVSGVTHDSRAKALVGWKRRGSSAAWNQRMLEPGTYNVKVQYGVSSATKYGSGTSSSELLKAGGTFELRLDTNLTGAEREPLTATVESTGGWTKYKTLNMGTIELSSHSADIVVEVTGLEGLGLMYLKKITFSKIANTGRTSPEPDELVKARLDHLEEVNRRSAGLRDTYLEELSKLEREFLDEDDLVSATVVMHEMAKVRASEEGDQTDVVALANQEPPLFHRIAENATVLPAARFDFKDGQLALDPIGEFITQFRPAESHLEWDLRRFTSLDPGYYNILLTYRTGEEMGGSYVIETDGNLLEGSLLRTSFLNREEGFITRSFGTIQITPAARSLKIRCLKLNHPEGSFLDLKSVTLSPLKNLQPKPEQVGKFTRLAGARLSGAGTFNPDGFRIFHNGQRFDIRLFSVNSPTSGGNDGGDDFATYFSMLPKNTKQLRRAAVAFATKKLEGRRFTVFKSNETTRDRHYAYVEVDGALLSSLLVENGLAMIEDTGDDLPTIGSRAVTRAEYLEHLRLAEQEAKALKRGAWKYFKEVAVDE